jgi:hypothetical protein
MSADENKNQSSNNQGDSKVDTTQNVQSTQGDAKTNGVTSATAKDEIVFKDPEMQKAWTQKTQTLAEERRKFEEEQKKWHDDSQRFKTNSEAFEYLAKDPKFVEWYKKTYSGESTKVEDISEEEEIGRAHV